jgi:hypothetical protein
LLHQFDFKEPNIFDNSDNEKSEYPVKVEWIKSVNSKEAKWKSKADFFTIQAIKASLQGQKLTRAFLERAFNIKFKDLLLTE